VSLLAVIAMAAVLWAVAVGFFLCLCKAAHDADETIEAWRHRHER
jgi:hypothetical protein